MARCFRLPFLVSVSIFLRIMLALLFLTYNLQQSGQFVSIGLKVFSYSVFVNDVLGHRVPGLGLVSRSVT